MYKTVSTAKELGNAICSGDNKIVITGSLGNAVLRVEAIGPIAWGVLIGAVGMSIFGISATVATGGIAAPVATVSHFVAFPAAVAAAAATGSVCIWRNCCISIWLIISFSEMRNILSCCRVYPA